MRRWLVLLLCIYMMFSLSSCGSRGDEPETGSRDQSAESGQTQTVQQDLAQPESGQPDEDSRNGAPVQAADEKAENARPALVNHVENMDQYDTVFLGFPNWWYTVPMAVHSFLDEYDFKGKTVISFVTHGTGGLASTVQDITADLPDSEILEPIGVYRPEVDNSKPDVDAWLDSLGFKEVD